MNYSKKQIDPMVKKYNINVETNEVFKRIIEMFDGQTNYQIWAIKAIFENVITMTQLEHLKQFADENQTMIANLSKQNLVSYKTKADFALLEKEIVASFQIALVKRCIEQFNTRQRDMFKNLIFGSKNSITPSEAMTSTFKRHYEFFRKFDSLKADRKHNLIVTASAIDDINFLIKHIEDAFNKPYDWDKADLMAYLKTHKECENVNIVYDKDSIVILEIPNFEASKSLCGNGRTSWCLTRENSYFNNYVTSKNNRQFFYFDFSKPEKNELAHVGFTVSSNGSIPYAHSTANNNMAGSSYIRYNNQNIGIEKLLEMHSISKNIFNHLNGIKGFEWTINSVRDFICSNPNTIAVCSEKDNRIIVKFLNGDGYRKLCHNTLINASNLRFDDKSAVYAIIDLNVDAKSELCMVTASYDKDVYGTMSAKSFLDAYNTQIDKLKYLKGIGFDETEFLGKEKIAPSILLHKYLDEKNEDKAVELIASNPSDFDINCEFNNNLPIFTAIQNGLFKAFEMIVRHKNFNANSENIFGEPLLSSLIYEYRAALANHEDSKAIKHMIDTIINISDYNFDAQDMNLDTPLSISAERSETSWIFDILIKNPKINVNNVNDVNRSVLGTAIYFNNRHAIELIGQRPDLKVTESDTKLAAERKINLADVIKPQPFETHNVSVSEETSEMAMSGAEMYKKMFLNASKR